MSLPLVPDANHPAFPTRSQVDDWEINYKAACNPRQCRGDGRDWTHGQRCAQAKYPQKNSFRPVASAPTHSTQNIASKPAREQERAARPTRRAKKAERTQGHEAKKKNSREPKEGPKKIKTRASAWRNKRNKNRKWRQYKDQSKREPKWKDIARS